MTHKPARQLAACALLAFTVPAFAQKAALTQDRDAVGRNFHAELASCDTSTSPTSCLVHFPAVAAGKRFVITHVTGNIALDAADVDKLTLLQMTTLGTLYSYLPVNLMPGTSGGTRYFVFNQEVLYVLEPGTQYGLAATFGAAVHGSVDAQVHGYLIDYP